MSRVNWYARWGKRAFDLVLVGITLPVWLPVVGCVAVAVRMFLGRPVLFRQSRPGIVGQAFTLLKFRTMRVAHDSQGRPLPDDQRLGRFGRILRASSLDELPTLWNVIKGDMSLVGPRPLLMQYLPRYSVQQARRHEVRPGITGWAQVQGRNAISWEEKFELDVWYVDHICLRLDLWILVKTIWRVIGRHGISQPGRATMDEFQGPKQGPFGQAEGS